MAAYTGLFGMGTAGTVAAAVAALLAGGYVVREGIRSTQPPEISIEAPENGASAPVPAAAPAPVPDVQSDRPAAAETVASDPEPATEEPAAPEMTPPGFDVVRVDPDGTSVVAGTAMPGSEVVLYLDGAQMERTGAGPQGKFAMFLFLEPSDQPRVLTLVSRLEGREVRADDQIILAPMPPQTAASEPEIAPEPEPPAPAEVAETGAGPDTGPEAPAVAGVATEPAVGVAALEPEVPPDPTAGGDAVGMPSAITESVATEPSDTSSDDLSDTPPLAGDVVVAPGVPGVPDGRQAPAAPAPEGAAPRVAAVAPAGPESGPAVTQPSADLIPAPPPRRTPEPAEPNKPASVPGPAAPAAERAAPEVIAAAPVGPASDRGGAAPIPETAPAPMPARAEATPEPGAPAGASAPAAPEPEAAAPVVVADLPPMPSGAEAPGVAPGPDIAPAPLPPRAVSPDVPDAPAAPDPIEAQQRDFAAAPSGAGRPTAVTIIRAGADGVELLQPGTPSRPEALDRLALDTISYSEAGEVQLSGRAPDGTAVRVYLDNRPVTDLAIDGEGRWAGELGGVQPGVYTLRLDQVSADGRVGSRLETPFKREAPAVLRAARADLPPDAPEVSIVTVQRGDTLWAISRQNYGSGFMYVRVFEANRDAIRDPDLIYPGQIFTIPN